MTLHSHSPDEHKKILWQALEQCGLDDPRGIELFRLLSLSARLLDEVAEHDLQAHGLSFPRLRLLVWLYVEERRGNTQGVPPSQLSDFQHVSRNTVSSLLRSLEERGLIERALCSDDRRMFHIRLSQAGRDMVCTLLPRHNALLLELFSDLSDNEQTTLAKLLTKLAHALLQRAAEQGLLDHDKTDRAPVKETRNKRGTRKEHIRL